MVRKVKKNILFIYFKLHLLIDLVAPEIFFLESQVTLRTFLFYFILMIVIFRCALVLKSILVTQVKRKNVALFFFLSFYTFILIVFIYLFGICRQLWTRKKFLPNFYYSFSSNFKSTGAKLILVGL